MGTSGSSGNTGNCWGLCATDLSPGALQHSRGEAPGLSHHWEKELQMDQGSTSSPDLGGAWGQDAAFIGISPPALPFLTPCQGSGMSQWIRDMQAGAFPELCSGTTNITPLWATLWGADKAVGLRAPVVPASGRAGQNPWDCQVHGQERNPTWLYPGIPLGLCPAIPHWLDAALSLFQGNGVSDQGCGKESPCLCHGWRSPSCLHSGRAQGSGA